jgi:hypothetical protein
MVATFRDAFVAQRNISPNGHRPKRTPLLVSAGRLLGRHLPRWGQVRTAVMATVAGGSFTWAAWTTDPRLGAIVLGISVLVGEALGKSDGAT